MVAKGHGRDGRGEAVAKEGPCRGAPERCFLWVRRGPATDKAQASDAPVALEQPLGQPPNTPPSIKAQAS